MRFSLPFVGASALLLPSAVSAWEEFSTKPPIDPPFNADDSWETTLRQYLPPKPWTSSHWSSGWAPDICKSVVWEWNLNIWDVDVLNVTYPDCGTPWVVCRHKAHPQSEQEIFEMIGRIPVRTRQSVATYIALPRTQSRNGDWPGAAGTGDTFSTYWDANFRVQVLLHELGHSLDMGVLRDQVGRDLYTDFSLSDPFWDAVESDAATNSNTNVMIESIADLVVLVTYDMHVPGGYEAANPSWRDVQNQVETLHHYGLAAGDIFRNQGRCNANKARPHPAVPM